MSYDLRLYVTMPGDADATGKLTNIGHMAVNGNLPPMLPPIKGFLKHMETTAVEDDTLIFQGTVEDALIRPVLSNAETTLQTFMMLPLIASMSTGVDVGNIKVTIACVDMTTSRATHCSISQLADDAAAFATTGRIRAPLLEYGTVLDASVQDENPLQVQVWEGTPKEMLETMLSYLEAGRTITN
jgi:hypothetical protein